MAWKFNPLTGTLDYYEAGVTDHGALTGLADDDHAQYLLLAGRAGGQTIAKNLLLTGDSSGYPLTIQSGTVGPTLNIENTATTRYSQLLLSNTNGAVGQLFVNGSAQSGYGGFNSFNLYTSGLYPISFATNNLVRLFVGSTGNVGVGSTDPSYNFVVESGTVSPTIQIKNTATSLYSQLLFDTPTGSVAQLFVNSSAQGGYGGANSLNIYTSGDYPITFAPWNTVSLVVKKNAIGIAGVTSPTAYLHIAAGTASTAPVNFTSGTLLSSAKAGAVEFLGDDIYFTITTGTARKMFVLNDGTALTSGRVPFATTNGRLTDDADFTFATDTLTVVNEKITDTLSVPKTSGKGIKVDTATPTFGWRDILGEVKILSPGANDPTLATFRDTLKQFSFSNAIMNEVHMTFHMPHDYVPGSDVYIHTHWSQNVVDTGGAAGAPGAVKWQFEVAYAKGHNQAAFPASFTTSSTQTASGTQYQHLISEIQLSAASPSATQIDSDIIEPDGIILVRVFRDPTDVADTLNQVPFLHYTDLHYQSTNIATKQKAPDFWT